MAKNKKKAVVAAVAAPKTVESVGQKGGVTAGAVNVPVKAQGENKPITMMELQAAAWNTLTQIERLQGELKQIRDLIAQFQNLTAGK